MITATVVPPQRRRRTELLAALMLGAAILAGASGLVLRAQPSPPAASLAIGRSGALETLTDSPRGFGEGSGPQADEMPARWIKP